MQFLRSIIKTSLFKATSLNSISIALKILIGLATSKVIAVFVGPSGLALVGNLRNFLSSMETFATFGFQNGITKYVAENDSDNARIKKTLSTAFISIAVVSVISGLALFGLADFWNDAVFGPGFEYGYIFKVFAFALPWYALSVAIIAAINGLGKFREVIYITIFGNIIGLVVSVLMILRYHTFGALLAIIITPSLVFFAAFYFLNKELNWIKTIRRSSFDPGVLRKLSAYSLMALVSAVISPLVFLAIRKNVIASVGLEKAGYWVTIDLISNYYLMFISTLLTVYFFPKLAVARTNRETKKVLYDYYKNIIPVFITGLAVIYFLRDFILQLLFTKSFAPVSQLFPWQLSGDVLKACSLILGYNMIARKLTAVFVITEIMSFSVMFAAAYFLVPAFGIQGIVMAHCLTYAVYLAVLAGYFRKSLF